MNGDTALYELLTTLNIPFEYLEHPPAPTTEIAKQYWAGHDAQHCKNLFFRNYKGDRHYLVILDCDKHLDIKSLENTLKQGRLSFASEKRLFKYLGVQPGSVTPFGLINDREKHVHIYIDAKLKTAERVSFHPCVNTASLIIRQSDFIKFLDYLGNSYEELNI